MQWLFCVLSYLTKNRQQATSDERREISGKGHAAIPRSDGFAGMIVRQRSLLLSWPFGYFVAKTK